MVERSRVQDLAAGVKRRLASIDPDAVAKSLMSGIDTATNARWEAAVVRAAALPGDIRPEKIRALSASFARELGTVGAAAGMAAATPLVGTGATLMAATVELSWFTARAGDLILTIAALHGRPAPTVEERKAWVLAVLIFGSTARQGLTGVVNALGAGLSEVSPNKLSLVTLRAANSAMSRLVVRRYGARRGAIALGTAMPLGIGAVIGAGANVVAIRKLAAQADSFFSRLPYSSIETTATDVGP